MILAYYALCLQSSPPPADPAQLKGSLVEIHTRFKVAAAADESTPKVFFPLPLDYRGQVPISFECRVKGKNSLVAGRAFLEDGNRIVELTLAPLKKGQVVEVEWKSLVMTRAIESFLDLPKTVAFPQSYPAEVGQWLRPSRYVQSDDPRIQGVARELLADDVVETVRRTILRCQKITQANLSKQQCTELSAVQALDRSGSCTSNANLMAALLRANSIPARVLSGYPTWVNRPYQTHYIVEAFVDGYGWYPIESTICQGGWSSSQMPIVSIVPLRNEHRGTMRFTGFAGVPYLSLTEAGPNLVVRGSLDFKTSCDHQAKTLRLVDLSPSFWSEARARWSEWLGQAAGGLKDLNTDVNPKAADTDRDAKRLNQR